MASEVGSAYVSIIPSAKGFGSKLNGSIGKQVDKSGATSGKRFGSGFSTGIAGSAARVGKAVALIAGPLAVLGGVRLLGNFVSDARESARVSALTAQAIKSTGGAAKVSAKDVSRLSTQISNKTGIDDEAIQSGANLLLTFTNIRNEVGKGNKIFDKANVAVTDMSAALGQDTKSSAIQLGKALNDPVKGITALSRVGVAFTAQQKDQIKTLVKSGDSVGAQKIILGELSKEFGGAAAAMATPGEKLKVTLGNIGESIGAQLIPFIDKFATFMVAKGIPALAKFGGFLKANVVPVLKQFGTFVQTTIIPALVRFGGFLQVNVLPALRALGTFVATKVLPALKSLANFVIGTVVPIFGKIFVQVLAGVRSGIASIKGSLDKNKGSLASFVAGFKTVVTFIVVRVLPLLGPILKTAFVVLGRVIGVAITVLVKLAHGFQNILRVAIPVLASLVKFFLSAVGFIVNGAAKALGWIPGLGGKLKNAANAFNGFKTTTSAIMTSLAKEASGWGKDTADNYNRALAANIQKSGKVSQSVAVGTANKVTAMSRSGGAFGPGGGGGDTIIVNNPKEEPASESVAKAVRRKKRRQGVPPT